MRFMVIVKASKNSEAGVMPSQELLADTVVGAVQDHIKALAAAMSLGAIGEPAIRAVSDPGDNDAFLTASWNVVQAERRCDELLRQARRVIFAHVQDPSSLMLANDLAMTLELASDRLVSTCYALRNLVFKHAEVSK